jgi:hypothetical protein
MYKFLTIACFAFLTSCAATDFSKPCLRIDASIDKVSNVDKRLAAIAQSLMNSCNGNSDCIDAVVNTFLPVNVLIQSTYEFAESLQRGGVCSEESVSTLEATADKIVEIYNAYTK